MNRLVRSNAAWKITEEKMKRVLTSAAALASMKKKAGHAKRATMITQKKDSWLQFKAEPGTLDDSWKRSPNARDAKSAR
jgi:hypothetical protein